MAISLYPHQAETIDRLRSGSILVGGVGSGKSRTSLAYYYDSECGASLEHPEEMHMTNPKDLYIITTARKRDTKEWEKECSYFLLSSDPELNPYKVKVVIDSWNNICKYSHIKDAFFIFDEQRLVGNGVWVKSFLKITKSNNWILLSATPGDTWMDYIPVFIANGYYKNRTEFIRRHVIFNSYSKFPKVERYIETYRLVKIRDSLLVHMSYEKKTTPHNKHLISNFDSTLYDLVQLKRWHVYEDRPIKDVAELCYVMRRIVNSDPSRLELIEDLIKQHPKVIIFYNFNYERELLLELGKKLDIPTTQWNGHKHEAIPNTDKWIYIVQYAAGSEGWNCIETDTIIFYSQNYSYKATVQAAGRIDRLNTTFKDLNYYYILSKSSIDMAIKKALDSKRSFNELDFSKLNLPREKNNASNRRGSDFASFSYF